MVESRSQGQSVVHNTLGSMLLCRSEIRTRTSKVEGGFRCWEDSR